MNNYLMQDGLFALLEHAARHPGTPCEDAHWQAAFEAFRLRAATITDQGFTPQTLRMIEHARIEVRELLRQFDGGTPCLQSLSRCRKMLDILDAERRLVLLGIEHPQFTSRPPSSSPLYLNDGFRPTDLAELIVPLYEMRFFCGPNKRPVMLKTLVAGFESTFNVPMPNFAILRRGVINRKLHPTPLLDRMREVLIDLSQR